MIVVPSDYDCGSLHLIVHLKSPPVDGKANQELIALLAKEFNVTKRAVRIKSGAGSRQKIVEIDE
jgi:uncharacterized protein (TIGR00251 family)